MTKRIIHILLLLLVVCAPAHAVLKERDLASTLAILRQELTNQRNDLNQQAGMMKEQQTQVTSRLISVLQRSQQNSLMLYSQKQTNIFDLTYACHEATEAYRMFLVDAAPFSKYIDNANMEVARFDSLIIDLSQMQTGQLSEKAKTDRNVCLTLAINIRRTLKANQEQTESYVKMYKMAESQLKRLDDYANKRYQGIQQSIFSNSQDTYWDILSNMRSEYRQTQASVVEKYRPSKVPSDWDSRIIFGLLVLLLGGTIAAVVLTYLNVGVVMTWLVNKGKLDFLFRFLAKAKRGSNPKEAFLQKRTYILLAVIVVTFAIILGVLRIAMRQNFIVMASELLVQYAWLIGVILFSLIIRLDGKQINAGFRIYLPIMAMCLLVISFRIILIPSSLVNLIFLPMLLVTSVWQWQLNKKYQQQLPRTDVAYSYISQLIFVISIVASFLGYTLLSVEILIWWTMQMTCILTITCATDLLRGYGNDPDHLYFDAETPITKSWGFLLIYQVLMPVLCVGSVILAIYWATDVFNLTSTTWQFFNMRLIDSENLTFSINALAITITLFFLFRYINKTAIKLMDHHFWQAEQQQAQADKRKATRQNVESRLAMWRNVIQVLVWGVWLLVSMELFHINNSWLVAISAGLSTGIGFAMKDILENLYYGISLMAGRVKVGDFISIDNTRGTVKNLSYVSTTIEALDGSVITFQNSQMFSKNYKNLTKNHGNELETIEVGVAYGSNAKEVREIIGAAVKALNRTNYIRYVDTVFSGLGDSSIDFKVLVWVDARRRSYAHSDILEAIYNALNEHKVEIPFPQRDVHIINS